MTSTHPSLVTTLFTWIALGALAVVVFIGEIALVQTADSLARDLPEFAHLKTPLVTAAIAFGVSVEILLGLTGALVGYIRADRIFHPSALRLVDVLVATVAVATGLVVSVLPSIPGPPLLAFAILAGVLIGTTVVLVLLVLRSLLRHAASMRVELDEVV